jgi:hypothetical protein
MQLYPVISWKGLLLLQAQFWIEVPESFLQGKIVFLLQHDTPHFLTDHRVPALQKLLLY